MYKKPFKSIAHYNVIFLFAFVSLFGVFLYAQEHFDPNNIDNSATNLEGLLEKILMDPSLEGSAQTFVNLAIQQDQSDLVQTAFQMLSEKGLEDTPAGIRLTLGLIENDLGKQNWESALRRLPRLCAEINNDPDRVIFTRRALTQYVWGLAPVSYDKENDSNDAFTRKDLAREIATNLILEPSMDWHFFVNLAVLELKSDNSDFIYARKLLDQSYSWLPEDKQQHIRWLWMSTRVYIELGRFDEAYKELDKCAELSRKYRGKYSSMYGNKLEGLRQKLQEKNLKALGLYKDVKAAESLVMKLATDYDLEEGLSQKGSEANTQTHDNNEHDNAFINESINDVIPKIQSDNELAQSQTIQNKSVSFYVVFTSVLFLIMVLIFTCLMQCITKRTAAIAVSSLLLVAFIFIIVQTRNSDTQASRFPQRPQLTQDIHDMGRQIKDATVEYTISVFNPGDKLARIMAVKPNCGCTTIDNNSSSIAIQPNKTATIHLRANLNFEPGPKTLSTVILLEGFAPMIHQAKVEIIDRGTKRN